LTWRRVTGNIVEAIELCATTSRATREAVPSPRCSTNGRPPIQSELVWAAAA
jgi:hypothetical protein